MVRCSDVNVLRGDFFVYFGLVSQPIRLLLSEKHVDIKTIQKYCDWVGDCEQAEYRYPPFFVRIAYRNASGALYLRECFVSGVSISTWMSYNFISLENANWRHQNFSIFRYQHLVFYWYYVVQEHEMRKKLLRSTTIVVKLNFVAVGITWHFYFTMFSRFLLLQEKMVYFGVRSWQPKFFWKQKILS